MINIQKIVLLFSCFLLVGCSTISGMMNVKEHDSVLALAYVDSKITTYNADCEVYETLEDAWSQVIWMHEYAIFVNDPQKETTGNVVSDIDKAIDYSIDNIDVCNRFLNLAKIKLKILKKTWSSR